MERSDSNWYLVYTKPRNEDAVSYKLNNAGFQILNPKIRERKFYRRKLTELISPLFPSYVFVKFDRLRDYHLIRYTRGIKNVLGNDQGPSAVPDNIIDSIASRLDKGIVTIRQNFEPGDRVLIKGGPFEGFEAIFEKEMQGLERVSILLKAINIRVVVDAGMLSLV